jgi:NitT/TauT family transport system permease protein
MRTRFHAGAEGLRKVVLPLAFVVVLVAFWEGAVRFLHVSSAVLAAPSAIAKVYAGHGALLLTHIGPTASEALMGFGLASIAGIGLGTLISFSARVRQALYPNMVAFQLIPKIAVAPLFTLWFGIGMEGRLLFITFMAFFPMAISTMTGLLSTPEPMLKLCRALRATPWQTFQRVRFPCAVPHIFAGMKVGATMAILGTVVAEFITAQKGLGFLVMFGSSAGESAVVLAAVGLLCAIGVALFGAVAAAEQFLRRRLGANSHHRSLAA